MTVSITQSPVLLANLSSTVLGPQPIFIQPTSPVTTLTKYIWIQTDVGNDPNAFTIWFEDGQ